jgi:hypothetical protein
LWAKNPLGEKRDINLEFLQKFLYNEPVLNTKGENMKKIMLALFAVLTLAACTGSYKSGNCEYDFLLHKDISISKIIGNVTGGC